MTLVSGWGRFPVVDSELLRPRSFEAVGEAVAGSDGAVARGNGRAYGDAAIGACRTVSLYPYFFSLDSISAWNRICGRRGFLQHQCVIPEHGRALCSARSSTAFRSVAMPPSSRC